ELIELDDPPKLDLRKKHTIEVVVDRFKVKAEISQRLAESFETALKLADNRAMVVSMDNPEESPHLFSGKFACPICGYSISELEPRIFSFNNPVGACPTCDGLGVQEFFDAELVVSHPELSCAGGAIRKWDRRNVYYFQMLQSLAAHYDFDVEAPFETLPQRVKDVILYGSDEEPIRFRYLNEKGRSVTREHPFEGVIPNMERRYDETDSSVVREELSKYLSVQPCEDCSGDRLNIQARHVFIGEHNLPAITRLPIRDAAYYFEHLSLEGHLAKVGEKVITEITNRLHFLVNVGLDYLSLDRSAETLSGGEAQRIRLASQIGSGLVGVMYVLDEPSIGLHQRDNDRLLNTLTRLRDLGNTVIVVEHDEEAIRSADHVVDIGPGAGIHGGKIVAQGSPAEILQQSGSLTADFLSGRRSIQVPSKRVPPNPLKALRIEGATGNNLKEVTVDIPAGLFVVVT
ncbi:MAG: excinuclease ABC subunit A, partial [Planctomycetaceae bacterium]|nr:excinuclease ABC subunit A [Planctomycetaceae bacterium]